MTEAVFEEFEDYSDNRMSPAEQQTFEERLRQDASLRTALTDYQRFRHSIEAVQLKRQLDAIHDRLDQEGALQEQRSVTTSKASRRLWIQLAVAAVFLLVVGYSLFWTFRPTLAEQTYLTYYQPEPTARGASACDPGVRPALDAYRAGRYKQALVELDRLSGTDRCVRYYAGLTQLALDNASAAIANLEQAIALQTASSSAAPPDPMVSKAEWYLALAYLKANRVAEARKRLDTMARQSDHPFQRLAQKALVDLQHD